MISLEVSETPEVNITLKNVDVSRSNIDSGACHLNGFKVPVQANLVHFLTIQKIGIFSLKSHRKLSTNSHRYLMNELPTFS